MSKNEDLYPFKLKKPDWDAIELITKWLQLYRQATELMSSTKSITISSAHRVLHKLQEHIRNALRSIPDDAPPQLKQGLIRANMKLSDYHVHFDESPFYLWSCRSCFYYISLM